MKNCSKTYYKFFSTLSVILCCTRIRAKAVALHTRRGGRYLSCRLICERDDGREINLGESVFAGRSRSLFLKVRVFFQTPSDTRTSYVEEKRERERKMREILPLTFPFCYALHSRAIVKIATGSTRAGRNDDFHVVLSKEVCTSCALGIDSSIASHSVSLLCRTRNFGIHIRIGKLDSRNIIEMMLQYQKNVGRRRACV